MLPRFGDWAKISRDSRFSRYHSIPLFIVFYLPCPCTTSSQAFSVNICRWRRWRNRDVRPRLARSTWPETHRPRAIMRPRDSASFSIYWAEWLTPRHGEFLQKIKHCKSIFFFILSLCAWVKKKSSETYRLKLKCFKLIYSEKEEQAVLLALSRRHR